MQMIQQQPQNYGFVQTLSEGDLLTAYGITKTNIGLILQPALNSNTIYMAGVWRGDPAATGATNTLDVYLGFES